jgi:hypothetical protein
LLLIIALVAMVPAATWIGPAIVWRPLPLAGEPPADDLVRIAGAVHVHTTCSDGSGTPEHVVREGQAAGLSFLVITDHNTDAGRSVQGYRDGMLVLAGVEISTNQGHILGLGMRPLSFPLARDASKALDDVRHLGGAAFVAHPTSARDDLAWKGWDLDGPWGLEVLNMDSLWREASWLTLLGGLVAYPFDAAYGLVAGLERPDDDLLRWDALLRRRRVTGLAGVDAHGFPSYRNLFRALRNYVLLDSPPSGEFDRDAAAIVAALTRGRSYMAVDAFASAGGFFFHATRGSEMWQMGDTVAPAPDLLLRAGGRLPKEARIELYRNGDRVAHGQGDLTFPVRGPGAYRVEVRIAGRGLPWIVSNPIYVYGAAEAAARARRAAWPVEPPPPPMARPLDAFADGSPFAAESDAGTWVDPEVRVASERASDHPAARLHFRAAASRPDPTLVWSALVDRSRRDLSRDTGLVFDIRADGEYRVWVGLWEERRDGADDPNWWLSSVRTSTAWRRHAIPFAQLHPVQADVGRSPDLKRVMGLVFFIDRNTYEYVREGTIWFDRLGTY